MSESTIEHALSNPVISQFVGLIVGLFTSFFSWWVLFRWMSPRLALSDAITKSKSKIPLNEDDDKTGFRYRIKFENRGRRPVIDLQVRVYVRIKGLIDPLSTIWEVVHLPLATDGEKTYSIAVMNPVKKSKLRTRLRICVNHTDYCTRPHFPKNIREKAAKKELLLEDLLLLGTATEIRVVLSGFDELTGARKVFMKTYLSSNILLGTFTKNGLGVILAESDEALRADLQQTGAPSLID